MRPVRSTSLFLVCLLAGCSQWNVVEKSIQPQVIPSGTGTVTLLNLKPTALGNASATVSFKVERPSVVTEYGVVLTTDPNQVGALSKGTAAPLRRSVSGAIAVDGTVNFDVKELSENSLYFAVAYAKDAAGNPAFSPNAVGFQTKFGARNANWRQLANLPIQRAYSFNPLFTLNGKVYVGGAAQEQRAEGYYYFKQLYEYDPETNIWTQKKDFPGTGRSEATVAVLNGKAYILFGLAVGKGSYTADAWEYDPGADAWRSLATPPLTRAGGQGDYNLQAGAIPFTYGNRVFALFGRGAFNKDVSKTSIYNSLYALDPGANQWEVSFPFDDQKLPADVIYGAARSGAFSFQYGDWVYFGGGLAASSYNASTSYGRYFNSRQIWAYNMATRELKKVALLPNGFNDCADANATGGRMAGFAFVVGSKAYITDCSETQVFVMDLGSGNFTPQLINLRASIGARQSGTTGIGIGVGNKGYFGLRNADWWEFTP